MPGLITVALHHLRFFAFHGLYEEERRTGNEFEVNLSVQYEPATELIEGIGDTINYAGIFELVKKQMEQPQDLLETLAMKMAEAVHTAWPQVKKIEVTVSKLHPPITSFAGNVSVTYSKDYLQ